MKKITVEQKSAPKRLRRTNQSTCQDFNSQPSRLWCNPHHFFCLLQILWTMNNDLHCKNRVDRERDKKTWNMTIYVALGPLWRGNNSDIIIIYWFLSDHNSLYRLNFSSSESWNNNCFSAARLFIFNKVDSFLMNLSK